MTRRRWIADEISDNRAALTGDHAHHLAQVLRAKVGQDFDISTGKEVRRGRISSIHFSELELYAVRMNARNTSSPNFFSGGNIEVLADLGAQDLRQMVCVVSGKSRAIIRYFVGNPTAAGHHEECCVD